MTSLDQTRVVTAEFTRPADTTSYAANDVVSTLAGALMEFDGVCKPGGSGYVVGARVITNKNAITPTLRLHLFRESVTAIADNAACTQPAYADRDKYVGFIDIGPLSSSASGAGSSYGRDVATRLPFTVPKDDKLHGILETRDVFDPNSAQTFSVALLTEVN